MSHLLNIVKVVLIEYHKKVRDAANRTAATVAFAASLLRMNFPYRSRAKYRAKIRNDTERDIAKYNHKKRKASMVSSTSFNGEAHRKPSVNDYSLVVNTLPHHEVAVESATPAEKHEYPHSASDALFRVSRGILVQDVAE